MEHLETQIRELEDAKAELEAQGLEIWRKLETAKDALVAERMKTIEKHKSFYAKKLERIKKTVDIFVTETAYMHNGVEIASRNNNLKYGFRKKELPYKDDYHEVMQDPMDFMIVEYDLLGMEDYLEVRVDYHSEALKDFVEEWMSQNIPHMGRDDDLFGFRV